MSEESLELKKENMHSNLKNMMFKHLLFLGLFIVLAYVISTFLFEFQSPFCDGTPSQLVFLACIVTSTVALTVIGNRFRDRMDDIDKEKLAIEEKEEPLSETLKRRLTKINNSHDACKLGLFHMTYILAVQVIMTCLTSFRILFKWQSIDIFLIWGSVYLFGVLWVFYFFNYGGGQYFSKIYKK